MASNQNNSQNIQVVVRCRPLNEKEKKSNASSVIECNEKRREVNISEKSTSGASRTFTFDKVFGVHSKQTDVYNQVVRPVVNEVMEGYNCTIFAYGQTGTGKTFTMEGDYVQSLSDESSWEKDINVGIIPRAVSHLFSALKSIEKGEFTSKISFMELYNEELSDLLGLDTLTDTKDLRIYDDVKNKGSVLVPGIQEVTVKDKKEVYELLKKGAAKRQKATTLMNAQSSRSHSIFCVTVFIKEKSFDGEDTVKVGKLNLVDLAGSENIERSGAIGKRAAEAGKINKSLTTLGRVITALVEHREHIPYRESNLTRLLQDSLGGKTKTTIIATVSPAQSNIEETLSTLDYANKAKSIKNKPEVNQKLVKKELIKEYSDEIEKLKQQLHAARENSGVYLPKDQFVLMEYTLDSNKEEIRDLTQRTSR
jgi:kinesin family protein 11